MIDRDGIKNGLAGIIANPDTAPTAAAALQEQLLELFADYETGQAALGERDSRIKDLQDTNMKLFLSLTGGKSDREETPEHPEDGVEWFAQRIRELEKED